MNKDLSVPSLVEMKCFSNNVRRKSASCAAAINECFKIKFPIGHNTT